MVHLTTARYQRDLSAEEAQQLEWLETNGLGGFAEGTAGGLRTRRYHALLTTATHPPDGRMVLVNGFDAEVETEAGIVPLTTQLYAPGKEIPDLSRLESFTLEPWPCWTYRLDEATHLTFDLFLPQGQSAVVLRWSYHGPASWAKLRVRPFFSGRDFHTTHHKNDSFRFDPQPAPYGQLWHFYDGVPPVLGSSNGTYYHDPHWYQDFFYPAEEARGLDDVEDLAAPGVYEFDLKAGQAVLIFSAQGVEGTPEEGPAEKSAGTFAASEKARRAAFISPRHRAADQYVVQRGTGKSIIAGYPWFGTWGRDTFISLRGFGLATGRLDLVRDVLLTWAPTISEGMIPNRFPDRGETPEYNSVDASLWFVIVAHEFMQAARARHETSLLTAQDELFAAIESILTAYTHGTRYQIQADVDGLLACGAPGVQLTWMDAKVGERVITPRTGKPVEIQALWLNALGLTSQHNSKWTEAYEHGRFSFQTRFWSESLGYLYDVVDVDHQAGTYDGKLRPNQLFAVGGLPIALVEGERAARIMDYLESSLWTPLGPRSLAPWDPAYLGHYTGSLEQRDSAYHQGTVWPWLSGAFVEAWVRVRGNTLWAKKQARERFLISQLEHDDLPGLGHLPEIADGEPPHTARGCPFQAWSLAEIMRLDYQVLV